MSEFDRMDQDCIDMVHNNPRRRGVIRDAMILVPKKDAERFCAWEARGRSSGSWRDAAYLTVAALSILLAVLGVVV